MNGTRLGVSVMGISEHYCVMRKVIWLKTKKIYVGGFEFLTMYNSFSIHYKLDINLVEITNVILDEYVMNSLLDMSISCFEIEKISLLNYASSIKNWAFGCSADHIYLSNANIENLDLQYASSSVITQSNISRITDRTPAQNMKSINITDSTIQSVAVEGNLCLNNVWPILQEIEVDANHDSLITFENLNMSEKGWHFILNSHMIGAKFVMKKIQLSAMKKSMFPDFFVSYIIIDSLIINAHIRHNNLYLYNSSFERITGLALNTMTIKNSNIRNSIYVESTPFTVDFALDHSTIVNVRMKQCFRYNATDSYFYKVSFLDICDEITYIDNTTFSNSEIHNSFLLKVTEHSVFNALTFENCQGDITSHKNSTFFTLDSLTDHPVYFNNLEVKGSSNRITALLNSNDDKKISKFLHIGIHYSTISMLSLATVNTHMIGFEISNSVISTPMAIFSNGYQTNLTVIDSKIITDTLIYCNELFLSLLGEVNITVYGMQTKIALAPIIAKYTHIAVLNSFVSLDSAFIYTLYSDFLDFSGFFSSEKTSSAGIFAAHKCLFVFTNVTATVNCHILKKDDVSHLPHATCFATEDCPAQHRVQKRTFYVLGNNESYGEPVPRSGYPYTIPLSKTGGTTVPTSFVVAHNYNIHHTTAVLDHNSYSVHISIAKISPLTESSVFIVSPFTDIKEYQITEPSCGMGYYQKSESCSPCQIGTHQFSSSLDASPENCRTDWELNGIEDFLLVRYTGSHYTVDPGYFISEYPNNNTVALFKCRGRECCGGRVNAGISGMDLSLPENALISYQVALRDGIPNTGCTILHRGMMCDKCVKKYKGQNVVMQPFTGSCMVAPSSYIYYSAILTHAVIVTVVVFLYKRGHLAPWTRILRMKTEMGLLDYDVFEAITLLFDLLLISIPFLSFYNQNIVLEPEEGHFKHYLKMLQNVFLFSLLTTRFSMNRNELVFSFVLSLFILCVLPLVYAIVKKLILRKRFRNVSRHIRTSSSLIFFFFPVFISSFISFCVPVHINDQLGIISKKFSSPRLVDTRTYTVYEFEIPLPLKDRITQFLIPLGVIIICALYVLWLGLREREGLQKKYKYLYLYIVLIQGFVFSFSSDELPLFSMYLWGLGALFYVVRPFRIDVLNTLAFAYFACYILFKLVWSGGVLFGFVLVLIVIFSLVFAVRIKDKENSFVDTNLLQPFIE
ncbi:hypothetical protein PCE1_001158 [Barthelona sp. PCE]